MHQITREGIEKLFQRVAFDLTEDLLTSQVWAEGNIQEIVTAIESNVNRLEDAKSFVIADFTPTIKE